MIVTTPKTTKIIIIILALIIIAGITPMPSGLSPASITGGNKQTINVNEPYTGTISIDFSPPDSDFSDGTYSVKWGKWHITDSENRVLKESSWRKLITSPATITGTFTPKNTGIYYVFGTILDQQYTFDTITQTWSVTKETPEGKEVQQVTVVSTGTPITGTTPNPEEPPTYKDIGEPPVTTKESQTILQWLIAYIMSIITWIFG